MDLSLLQAALIPVVVGLTQVVKQLRVPKRFYPLVSLVFGVGLVYLTTPQFDLLTGIVVGLSAAGLYSGTKTVIE